MKHFLKTLILLFLICNTFSVFGQKLVTETKPPPPVKLTAVRWHGTGCFKIDMPMGTVYFEKDSGVSGFKSFIDNEGKDWIASYLPPGPNGDYRGFPNSIGNFGHAGRNSGSTTKIVDGKREGDVVVLESSNDKFTFQYWFFADRIAIKVLKSEGEYNFLLECVAGGSADAADYFVTADGKKHIPAEDGELDDFTPEWFYLGDPKAKNLLFLAKTPDDDAPNENHRQFRNGQHNMDLYSFGRAGKEENYKVWGMSGNDHICVIGFTDADRSHNEIAGMIESFLAKPFTSGVRPINRWSPAVLDLAVGWYSSEEARAIANSVIQYQSPQGGWPKSTDLTRAPLTPGDFPPPGRGRANSFDNNATTLPMEFLARVISATNDEKYKASFDRGLDYLFASQYPNGGWPQFWPLRGNEYYSRVTFNDEAMIRVMKVLRGAASGAGPYAFVQPDRRAKAKASMDRGLDFILKSQVIQNGKPTVWAAQYDENSMQPAWARKYEPPSLSGNESVDIVFFLMAIENPSREIISSINGAVDWLRANSIKGMRHEKILNPDGRVERRLLPDKDGPPLWARFYELGTNRPIYLDRDSIFHYKYSEVGYERRSGYEYNGYWAAPLLDSAYPAWRRIHFPTESTVIEAENGKFTGSVDRHSCWHNVMLTDAPHSTHSGRGVVDTKNETGSYIEVKYDAKWNGPHRITARYTHIKDDPRPGELLVNDKAVAQLTMQQTEALPAWKTESAVVNLETGLNVIRLRATREGGLPNMDYIKVAEVRENTPGIVPRIQILEAEDGNYVGKEDHHSCWNFIAQHPAPHSGFTGEGLVDTENKRGSYIEVTYDAAKAGLYLLGVRYVHGKPDIRSAEVMVNGAVSNPSLDLKSTGTWTNWSIVDIPVKLKQGQNVIRLTALGENGLTNLDHFVFTQAW